MMNEKKKIEIEKEIKEGKRMIDLLGITYAVTREGLIKHNHMDTHDNLINLMKEEIIKVRKLKEQLKDI